MKKGFTLKKKLNIAILGVGILVVSIVGTKAATTIQSNMVIYNDTTVKETLDELVEKATQSYELKRTVLPNSTSIDVKEYSDNWQQLTDENFAVITYSTGNANITAGHQYTVNIGATNSVSWAYDSTTGILTITLNTGQKTAQGVSDNNVKTTTLTSTVTPKLSAVYLYEVK